jgi:hypothetical protein
MEKILEKEGLECDPETQVPFTAELVSSGRELVTSDLLKCREQAIQKAL